MNPLPPFTHALKRLFQRLTGQAQKSKVFVVYGRNQALRRAMFDYLRAIGLDPIEWNQAILMTGTPAPYIGEIVEAAMQQAQAMVVLFTGDDEARLAKGFTPPTDPYYENEFAAQPRPNVIFESGLALGKYPHRTIIVQVGTLRLFSDIAGIHYICLNNSLKTRQELAQRLMLTGCQVDLSGTDWHNAGNFE